MSAPLPRDLSDLQSALRAKLEEAELLAMTSLDEIETLTTLLGQLTAPGSETEEQSGAASAAREEMRHRLAGALQRPASPQVAAPERQKAALMADPLFDATWYLQTYPDVAESGMDPAAHYLSAGTFEGRDPGPAFDTIAYYLANPDIADAGWPALSHYLMFGRAAGRRLA
ncbi:hypothetical protein [Salipiger abyssi]|uniref:hypothetical protein n=1 Tax=Salipiger abyssi TaxID=1250539 RepID=UPI0040591D6F